ncbi:MAG: NAD-glutamate dehydrogenase [Proteobacteria bacterium]|nr:NAD-glutamate dehydrogenase [Pseudomonadota bacterium]
MEKIQNLIDQIVSFSHQQKKYEKNFSRDKFLDFAKLFYLQNQGRDFVNYSLEEMYNSTLLSFNFIAEKTAIFKVRIYNPRKEIDGFESSNTFLEVVSDDMPFLVDSIVGHLDKIGLRIKNILHPIYQISRDEKGKLISVSTSENSKQESVIQMHLDKITAADDIKMLQEDISKIIEILVLVVRDWQSMSKTALKAQAEADRAKKIIKDDKEISEIKDFLSWITQGNFIFLGMKEFKIKESEKDKYKLEEVKGSGLGVFNSSDPEVVPEVLNSSLEEVCETVKNPYVIEILKSRYKSRIHRITNAERIRIQRISEDGKVTGEFRFVGLFTSSAYNNSPNTIPLVRNKIDKVIADSGFIKGSHNYKDLISVLESYPRDELFQTNAHDLLRIATGIVAICGRSQVRFFPRRDKYNRFVSCLIFTPRDRTNSELREKIKDYLSNIYNGEIADSFVEITESRLTRFHVIVRTNNGIPVVDANKVEREITNMTRLWSDDLREAVSAKFENEKRIALFAKYKSAFSVSYINRFDPKRAAIDIGRVEECLEKNSVLFNLYKSSDALNEEVTELKIYNPQKELDLSDIMPVLESFGFNVIQEHTYVVNPEEENRKTVKKKVWIHYFHLNLSKSGEKFSEKIKLNFEKTISLLWQKVLDVSSLNRLVVGADLDWKQIYLLRAYTKYIYQTGFRYSQSYIADVLIKYSDITKLLIELFEVKFNPALKLNNSERQKKSDAIASNITKSLVQVKDLLDDAVIKKFFSVIKATLRTNYYQSSKEGGFKGYVSFKFDCTKVLDLPLPLPYAEIFVYSSTMEGIHLRGGRVARGGLRWSDRQEDFRTEVLGLMKAQMTKNAVIVPVGSKGGFVVKKSTEGLSRDEILKDGIESYKTFLSGLLDITDNVIDGKIDHPQNCIMHDAADPYLVVAADKGTATFSDIANSVSAQYNFWLGDAFASGGSVGYDHKKMGITAKGGWISVKRHFAEMGHDTQSQDFTCVGIGDLAGDVFGNGMLLSKHIKLIAAFNHMHIFFDPNPDVAKSFAERVRIFNLPRSTWMDYNQSLISKGGGIFERSAKSIKISPEVKAVLAIEEDELEPNELIKAILKAPVDLLWNGGIGTYVKATDESHQEVGDRANDHLRINGSDLRCKVIGEGGNLGFTQKGRIEYALNGGRINTDAMDNSAGVDCSDHEVNIKIALIQAMRAKKITIEERNKILESMTDEVSDLVLSDNRLQTQAISIAASQGVSSLGEQAQFLDRLEKSGSLNRKIEFLPSKKDLDKRQTERIGMTRPELCVMLAYSKMDIYKSLLTSDLLKDKYFEHELFSYFPKAMQKKFSDELISHQLRNEIIATQLTNFVVNRAGITFVSQLCQESGFAIDDVVKSFIIACDSFRLREIWEKIEKLDGKVVPQVQAQMFLASGKLLERSTMWLLRNKSKGEITPVITRFRKIADELSAVIIQVLAQASLESFERKIERYCLNNVDRKLAEKIAAFDPLASVFDIAEISAASNFDLKTIAKLYFAVGTRFSLKWLRSKVSAMSYDNHWQKLSSKTILEDLYSYQMKIAKSVVEESSKDKILSESDSLENWIKKVDFLVERFDQFISELKVHPNPDISVFVVALNRLKPLVK